MSVRYAVLLNEEQLQQKLTDCPGGILHKYPFKVKSLVAFDNNCNKRKQACMDSVVVLDGEYTTEAVAISYSPGCNSLPLPHS